MLLPILKQVLLNDLEVLEGLRERRPDVITPVGGTVANHGALQVDLSKVSVELSLQVVPVDLPGEVRYVDTSVGLTADEETVAQELGELCEPVLECSKCILGLDHIVGAHVSLGASDRPADAGRALNEENVGALVPRVRVSLEVVLAVIQDNWA